MLAQNTFPQEYIDAAKAHFADADLYPTLVVALDHFFAHRTRAREGKNGNGLNEVRVIANSVMANGGVMLADTQIKLAPDTSVLGFAPGDRIAIDRDGFERLSAQFFTDLHERFT